MNHTSTRLQRLSESATLKMARLSRELKAQGKDIISLSLGEPDFDTPQFIKDAAVQAMMDGYTHYPPVNGYLELREAISNKFKEDNNLHYDPSQIVVSTGAKQSIANVMLALLNPGDEVLLPVPYWVSYEEMVKLGEGTPVPIKTTIKDDFKITPEQLEHALTDKTKLLVFSSPCNPTGSVYSKEELDGLAGILANYPNTFIISDEIYELINFTGSHASIGNCAAIKDRVITVNGLSKAYAMTGWRLGYLGAPQWIADACSKMQGQITSGANSITQRAAIAALNGPKTETEAMAKEFLRRKIMLKPLLEEIPGLICNDPEGAFYFFPNVSYYFGKKHQGQSIENSSDLCMYLLEHANVALVTGSAFGLDGCIRISYSSSEEILREAVSRIKHGLAQLTD